MKDLAGQISHIALLANSSRSASVNGSGVDISQFQDSLAIIADVKAVSGTTPTADIKIQDSADDSSYADVSGAALTQITTSDSKQTLRLDTRGLRKYIRAVVTLAGTNPVYLVSINGVGLKQNRS